MSKKLGEKVNFDTISPEDDLFLIGVQRDATGSYHAFRIAQYVRRRNVSFPVNTQKIGDTPSGNSWRSAARTAACTTSTAATPFLRVISGASPFPARLLGGFAQ
jgi:hypothetical protein